jgi:isocitrate dehydrogenase
MANYKNMLTHKDDVMRVRQGQYKDIVQAQAQQREWQISQLINQRNEQWQREQEAKERAERDRRVAMTEDRQRSLDRQLMEKKMVHQMN